MKDGILINYVINKIIWNWNEINVDDNIINVMNDTNDEGSMSVGDCLKINQG